ncbi:hypothetical protein XELAEV_18012791mg [Xenopus laevis]|uniref:TATA box-binding protein-associated factor RNA polymerase I subunit D n=1 Tax=Xenopus laevis TaxID=8355 RepID=A0A974DNR9_XENLA|nr:hypothetical protein XELAEV_18012791mg [Xenopus laevis]
MASLGTPAQDNKYPVSNLELAGIVRAVRRHTEPAAMLEEENEPNAQNYGVLQSQELFSDSDCNLLRIRISQIKAKTVIMTFYWTVTIFVYSFSFFSVSESSGSLFQADVTCTPSRTRRRRAADKPKHMSLPSSSDSSDFEPVPKYLPLKKILEQFRKKKKKQKKKRQRYRKYLVTEKKPHKPPAKKITITLQEKHRRLRERSITFPFTGQKYLQFKRYLPYEQSVFSGFLRYTEKLKYDRHLQNSLKIMDLGEDLENESSEMRKYGYLDDDGPISPIVEQNENTNTNNDEDHSNYDAKIVGCEESTLEALGPSWKKRVEAKQIVQN